MFLGAPEHLCIMINISYVLFVLQSFPTREEQGQKNILFSEDVFIFISLNTWAALRLKRWELGLRQQ